MAEAQSRGTSWRDGVARAAALWRRAKAPIAITGAGVSVHSGIPDFRSPGGLWSRFNPDRVATLGALRARPGEVWEFLKEAALVFGDAKPNEAHAALATLERHGKLEAVITQNIDGLHQVAGSERVVEFHGTAKRFYCMGCKTEYDHDLVPGLTREELPWTCERCGGIIRPAFVFFGEQIPAAALSDSLALAERADLAVIVGTSGTVAPANTLSYKVKARGGAVLEINRDASEFGDMPDLTLRGPAEEILPAIVRELGID